MFVRSTVHNARSLFPPSTFEKQEQRFARTLGNLDKAMLTSAKHTARQAYLKLLIHHWKERSGSGGPNQYAIRRACFRHHHESFKKLGHLELAALNKKAAMDRRQRIDGILVERHHVQAQLELLHRRHLSRRPRAH